MWRRAGARRGVRLDSPTAIPTEVPMRRFGLAVYGPGALRQTDYLVPYNSSLVNGQMVPLMSSW